MVDLLCRAVQGLILVPILFALRFFNIPCDRHVNFADDNFITCWNNNRETLARDMEEKLEKITRWLKSSVLKVNGTKTELCLFYRKHTHPISISLNATVIVSKKVTNVLTVKFNPKLQLNEQVANSIKRSIV